MYEDFLKLEIFLYIRFKLGDLLNEVGLEYFFLLSFFETYFS